MLAVYVIAVIRTPVGIGFYVSIYLRYNREKI